jgi:hypothetical protein
MGEVGARARVLVAVLGGIAGLAPPARAEHAPEPSVRVLLAESTGRVEVRRGGGRTVLAPAPGGLRVDGALAGGVWRASGGGSLVVDGLRVRGAVEVDRVPNGLRVVNEVPLEAYVAGTVGREVYPFWSAETLKAQAVVTRTYALHERERQAANSSAGSRTRSSRSSTRRRAGRRRARRKCGAAPPPTS